VDHADTRRVAFSIFTVAVRGPGAGAGDEVACPESQLALRGFTKCRIHGRGTASRLGSCPQLLNQNLQCAYQIEPFQFQQQRALPLSFRHSFAGERAKIKDQ
jgi:hypothetical protein